MERCLDANVAVKAVIQEELSEKARELIADASTAEIDLIAPHFFEVEIFSAVRKKVYSGEITVASGEMAFESLKGLPVQLLPIAHLLDRMWEIAKQCNLRWLYDAFYIAVAESRICTLWTADEELYKAAKDRFTFVKLLGDYERNI